jgi:hypothetical protein
MDGGGESSIEDGYIELNEPPTNWGVFIEEAITAVPIRRSSVEVQRQ